MFFVQHALEQRHGDGALLGQREAVQAMQQLHQALEVAREAGQDVVQHLVAEHDAVAARLVLQRHPSVALGERTYGVHRAPAEARAQVVPDLEVDRGQAARRDELHAQARAGRFPPVDLQVREDLRTRLGWGPVHQVHPLAEAGTRDALHQEARRRGIVLADEVLDYLLTRFARDLKSLMHLLHRLDGFALAEKRAITVPLLKRMLDEEGAEA